MDAAPSFRLAELSSNAQCVADAVFSRIDQIAQQFRLQSLLLRPDGDFFQRQVHAQQKNDNTPDSDRTLKQIFSILFSGYGSS